MAVKRTMPSGHTAGIFADMTLDGPEIGTLVAIVDRAKNLPNRKTMGKQDPYCAMRLGKEAKKTDTDRRGGQTPRWDQELRFTVRDAPDYYKLKVSIFNDDKKTDLIGECWIDLSDLIIPGGKANDLWHQLNFKGKYAGDIRLEMTYYDTKPNAEIEATKERQRQRANSPATNSSPHSAPRQLGPREIKRRPLPTGPGLAGAQPADFPQPLRIQNRQQVTPTEQPAYVHPHYVPQPQQYVGPEGPDDYEQYRNNPYADQYEVRDREYDFEATQPTYDGGFSQSLPPVPMEPPPLEARHSDPGPLSSSPQQGSSYYNSSPPVRPSPTDPRSHRMSSSPTKYAAYRDSPLRQSIAPQDVPSLPAIPPKVPLGYEDEPPSPPPPPPPAHRGSLPRPLELTYGTPPRMPQPPQRDSIGDRSPLQMIEHNYSPYPPSDRGSTQRQHRKSFNHSEVPVPQVERPTSSAGDFPAPHQVGVNYGVDFLAEPVEQDNQGRYIRRNSMIEDHDDPYRAPQRAQTFDSSDFDHANTYRSDPHVVRPRPVSPNVNVAVPRKSVSPAPPMDDRPQFGSTPFGPDSYNVLNPSSGPAQNGPRPTYPAKQEKPGEIEPIIGNDGRVIDPSDHLPAETWAPEPERKNRQPEHVIRIRTRADAQQTRAGSSPVAARTPPSHISYNSSPAPVNEPAVSPTSERRRNRLQKPMPATRPLPAQPFQHAQTSPAAIPQTKQFDQSSPAPHPRPPSSHGSQNNMQRSSIPSSPHSAGPPRPPLTDYQVPMYGRNSYYQTTPTKVQMPRPQSYAPPSVHDDPLAAELSMIDIGPSRGGGRTAVRSRGYSGY
ncbi:uncharacterized protein HMPREF1541_03064 [Cyphellophora europaea CBS 101466]|uniref:C2 domain-containing protein n=1 Tax=Cyphellophora europaea (strain CBS 101466) TaxID=1220924 RepID=W2RZL3_CYPE1|nr:uncharacterized protein HMPREF1541_03064 [Cyphellophora europaea CBS 101466]ETN41129.1 hypothetical protein HMPREF1541_03064 [Cyphellophora europaea CBS 101466]